jgi:hypothetical protein
MSEEDSEKEENEEVSEEKVAEEEPEETVVEDEPEEEVAEQELEKLLLKWNTETGQFDPIESDGQLDEGVFIELVDEERKWKYFYIEGASLIARRTALRSANGIAKTGYKHPETDVRYGVECKLEEEKSPYEDMPATLRVAQRAWYTKEKKKE